MDETANEIEARIDRTRERLGSNLRELEDRVDAATDWREHYRDRPYLFVGAALVGGAALGAALGRTSPTREREHLEVSRGLGGDGVVQSQLWELWKNIEAALVGLASARLTEYIGELVPGF